MSSIEQVTRASLALALDASAMQQRAVVSNIANAAVPGYRRQEVSFGDQLSAIRQEIASQGHTSLDSLRHIQPYIGANSSSGTDMTIRIDQELVTLTENAVRYQTLIKGLNKYFAIMSSAVNDGKR